ncbi:O-antigen ligase domain-containing protein [Clostridium perfringens]|uniref:O-antigen ligase family protein n=1 Tax=Clostridium perfringens TaxID=1502 RepID=UPI000F8EF881|nr:O-antigen ligase family protein [Clostridium perfringens]RUR35229.1 O-antigen ligase domain-containing protein [Clostridium perfringens]
MYLKVRDCLFYLTIISSFLFIKLFRVDSINYFYFSTVISIIFSLTLIKRFKERLDDKYLNILKYLILGYSIYVFILNLFIEFNGFIYTLNFLTPMITFLSIIYFIDSKEKLNKVNNFILYIFLITSLLALIMYIVGYSKVDISFDKFLLLTPTSEYIERFNEGRLTWLMSHKSRYALYCLIGIFITLKNSKVNIKIRFLTFVLLFINLILTNTMTSIIMGIFLVIIYYYDYIRIILKVYSIKINNINFLKYIIYFIILISFIILTFILFTNLDKIRDISSLGGRVFIWITSIRFIINNPLGIGVIHDDFILTSPYLQYSFTNAHNVFLNEMIEHGIVGGILFIAIFTLLLIIYWKNYDKKYFVANIIFIIGMFMDHTVSKEISFIFWYINAIWCSDVILSKSSIRWN